MSLRAKVLSVVVIFVILISLAISLLIQKAINDRLTKREVEFVGKDLQRLAYAFNSEVDNLDSTLQEWSNWDDSYSFMENGNQEYISSNLNYDALRGSRLDLLVFLQPSGGVMAGRLYEFEGQRELPLPPELTAHFSPSDNLIREPMEGCGVAKGLLSIYGHPMLIASRPIFTTEKKGPAQGVLIAGRFLGSAAIRELGFKAKLTVESLALDDHQVPQELYQSPLILEENIITTVKPRDQQVIEGYLLLEDLYGDPTMVFQIKEPRKIYEEGRAIALYIWITFIIVCGVSIATLIVLLEKLILRPMTRLSRSVQTVKSTGDLSLRVESKGKDELATLAESINSMLEELEESQRGIQESEERYRTLVEELPAVTFIIWFDEKVERVYVAPQSEEIIGYSPEYFEKNPELWLEVIHPDDREWVIREIESWLQSEDPNFSKEIRIITPDGRVVWAHVQGKVVADQNHRPKYFQGVLLDVTQRRLAVEHERQYFHDMSFLSRTAMNFVDFPLEGDIYNLIGEQLLELVGDSFVFIVSYDQNSGLARPKALLGAEEDIQAAMEFTGWNPLEMDFPVEPKVRDWLATYTLLKFPGGLYEIMYPSLPEEAWRFLVETFNLGETYAMAFTSQDEILGGAIILTHKDFVLMNQDLIEAYLKQASVAILRHRALSALKDSEERYRTVFESTGTAMCVIESDFTISFANHEFERMTGLVGKNFGEDIKITDIIFKEDLDEFVQSHQLLREEGSEPIRRFGCRIMGIRGEMVHTLVSMGLLAKSGSSVVSFIDVTREKEYEESLEERAKELRDFLSVASHELRHPITVIKGYTQVLSMFQESFSDEKLPEILQAMEASADRLNRLIQELLNVSRVEQGRFTIRKSKVELGSLVSEAVKEVRSKGGDDRFNVNVPEDVGEALVDRDKMIELLIILLENAVKYSPEASPVDLSVERGESEVMVSVMDRGRGIPEEEREKIFHRFYQLEDVEHHSTPGLGLGLYIAREIVKAHGGRIWCAPREGGGSIFSFTIPV